MYQTYLHHTLSIGGSLGSLYIGHHFPSLCVASFITEISTPFVNYRSIMLTQKQGHTQIFKLNLYIFGALFFLFRVLFYPVTTYRLIYGYKFFTEAFPVVKYRVSIVLSVMYCSLFFLQLLWFYKIIMSIVKQGKREKKIEEGQKKKQ